MAGDEKKIKALTGPEKTAIFFMTLGEEFTAEIFKNLEDAEIKNIWEAMKKTREVTPRQAQDVLWEFVEALGVPLEIQRGDDFFKNTLGRSLGGERAENLLKDISSPAPFSNIKHISPKALGHLIRNEHPQTIALVLAHIDPGKSDGLGVFVAYKMA